MRYNSDCILSLAQEPRLRLYPYRKAKVQIGLSNVSIMTYGYINFRTHSRSTEFRFILRVQSHGKLKYNELSLPAMFRNLFLYMEVKLLLLVITSGPRLYCACHWRRQLWGTGARASLDFQLFNFSRHVRAAQTLAFYSMWLAIQ